MGTNKRTFILSIAKINGFLRNTPTIYINEKDAVKLELMTEDESKSSRTVNGIMSLDLFESNYVNTRKNLPKYAVRGINKLISYAEKQDNKNRVGVFYYRLVNHKPTRILS